MAKINLKETRKCTDGFISSYLEYTKHQESPEDFHTWVAISLMASALGRNISINRGYFNVYPNLFIVLVAESAKLHKSSAISIGENLLLEACGEEVNLFSQKITTEGFHHFLSDLYKEKKQSVGTIHASEFSVFFGKSILDPTLIHLLTDYFDCPSERSYTTIGRGKELAGLICINMLAGTTPEWMKSSLPEDTLGGGFFARLLPVFRFETDRSNPFPEDSIDDPDCILARANCLHDLGIISRVRGQFTWTERGKIGFGDWYDDPDYRKEPADSPSFMRGYYGRKETMVIKLAMIHSISYGESMKIDVEDIIWALKKLQANEKYMADITKYMGASDSGKRISKVLELVRKHGKIQHSHLLRLLSNQMARDELQIYIDTLIESGQIVKENRVRSGPGRPGISYMMQEQKVIRKDV